MTSANTAPTLPRIHYLDNLRAWAVLLGVYLHGAFAYAQNSQTVWLATDSQASTLVDISIWFIHLFRMSLFFGLSGYFGRLHLERRGTRAFLKQRSLRLAVPFALFYPLLSAAMMAVIIFALGYLQSPTGLMGLIAQAVAENDLTKQKPPWSTMHLWFVYYLMMFSILATILARYPAINCQALFKRRWCYWLFPLALMPGAALAGTPLPAPESFVPELWPFMFYGLFYWLGWQLVGRQAWLDDFQSYRWPMSLVIGVLFGLYYCCLPALNLEDLVSGAARFSWQMYTIRCVLTAYLSAGLTLLAVLWGDRLLDRPSGWMRFMSDASYWVYLIHLPIVLFLQTLLAPLDWPLVLKLFLVLTATMLFSTATYLAFVRYTPLGWLLHGQRSFP